MSTPTASAHDAPNRPRMLIAAGGVRARAAPAAAQAPADASQASAPPEHRADRRRRPRLRRPVELRPQGAEDAGARPPRVRRHAVHVVLRGVPAVLAVACRDPDGTHAVPHRHRELDPGEHDDATRAARGDRSRRCCGNAATRRSCRASGTSTAACDVAAHTQPQDHGFEHWLALHAFAIPHHKNPTNFFRDGKALGEIKGFAAQIVADEAIGWLERRRPGVPFFLYVAFAEPHGTIASPDEWNARYAAYTDGTPDPVANGAGIPDEPRGSRPGRVLRQRRAHGPPGGPPPRAPRRARPAREHDRRVHERQRSGHPRLAALVRDQPLRQHGRLPRPQGRPLRRRHPRARDRALARARAGRERCPTAPACGYDLLPTLAAVVGRDGARRPPHRRRGPLGRADRGVRSRGSARSTGSSTTTRASTTRCATDGGNCSPTSRCGDVELYDLDDGSLRGRRSRDRRAPPSSIACCGN